MSGRPPKDMVAIDTPENIKRCLNCLHSNCMYFTINDCIKAEQAGKKPRKSKTKPRVAI